MNLPITFVVPGRPVPFIAQWNKVRWDRKRAFADYCSSVRLIARTAGLRDPVATREAPLHIHTRAFFADGRHPDPENVHKVIVDALMYKPDKKRRSSSADKFTGGGFSSPQYDDTPRVEVVVADGRLPLVATIPKDW